MRKINKNRAPNSWIQYIQTEGVDFQAIPGLRMSLLQEQGYVCAYCMRRIPVRDREEKARSKIEHILSRDNYPNEKLNYRNLVVCCPGAINKEFHCDKKKNNNSISFDLFDDAFFTTLSYSSKDGTIRSSIPKYDNEINSILNLNNPLLKENRRRALQGVVNMLNRQWTKSLINRQVQHWDNQDANGMYKEYCGIVLWYLNKKIKQVK